MQPKDEAQAYADIQWQNPNSFVVNSVDWDAEPERSATAEDNPDGHEDEAGPPAPGPSVPASSRPGPGPEPRGLDGMTRSEAEA